LNANVDNTLREKTDIIFESAKEVSRPIIFSIIIIITVFLPIFSLEGVVRRRDLGSVIADIKKRIANNIELPPGYYVEYGGQFENQQRAMTRLKIIVPVVITLVFLILCLTFGSIGEALLIIINVPLALIGGIPGFFLAGEYLSVPAAVGFIALFGIAVHRA